MEDVRRCEELIVVPGEEVLALKAELEEFLFDKVYHHYRVHAHGQQGPTHFADDVRGVLPAPRATSDPLSPARPSRLPCCGTVCDYLAGMTDRYAQDEFNRLFQPYSM